MRRSHDEARWFEENVSREERKGRWRLEEEEEARERRNAVTEQRSNIAEENFKSELIEREEERTK